LFCGALWTPPCGRAAVTAGGAGQGLPHLRRDHRPRRSRRLWRTTCQRSYQRRSADRAEVRLGARGCRENKPGEQPEPEREDAQEQVEDVVRLVTTCKHLLLAHGTERGPLLHDSRRLPLWFWPLWFHRSTMKPWMRSPGSAPTCARRGLRAAGRKRTWRTAPASRRCR